MSKDDLPEQYAGEKLYTIGTVSNLTGVGPITLRAWERRYELIEPVRKKSGHRLYTRHHIDQINRITALTGQGMRISQIQPAMLNENTDEDLAGEDAGNAWKSYLDMLIEAIVSFDEDGMDNIYNDVLALYPIELVTRNLLRPLLLELGLRWESRKGSVAEEHFFAFFMRNKLGARFHHRSRQQTGCRLLLAGLPGEFHEIALLLFALAASEQGYRLISLGANMPLDELAQVARQSKSDAIVLSGSMDPGRSKFDAGLTELVKESGIPVFIGGQASIFACDSIQKAGAFALGNDLELGLQRMRESLASASASALTG